jgi:hypothetical protein
MNITLTPENAAGVAWYAKILGCSESEFVNRYLEIQCDWPEDWGDTWRVIDAAELLAKFAFKSREEAQRVLDWYYASSKAEAQKNGVTVRIKTEIVEMDPCLSATPSLEDIGLDAVFMIRAATCYVDKENQPVIIVANPELPDDPEEPWSV